MTNAKPAASSIAELMRLPEAKRSMEVSMSARRDVQMTLCC